MSSKGCLAPSPQELARLVQVNGYMAQLKTQWLPSVALSPESRSRYEEEGEVIHERMVFDWRNNRAFLTRSPSVMWMPGRSLRKAPNWMAVLKSPGAGQRVMPA